MVTIPSYPELTASQRRVFQFIVSYKLENDGTSPTLREVMVGAGYRSTGSCNRTIKQLAAKGFIKIDYPHSRTIRVMGGSYSFQPPVRGQG